MIRRDMTYRVVPLHSAEADDARLGATVEERLRMVRELSRMAWASSGRPLPEYERREMPVRIRSLHDHDEPRPA